MIWAASVQASKAAKWLDADADRAGRVIVEPDLSVPGAANIFVVGDTAMVTDPGGKPVPGIAPAAKQQGEHVAQTIKLRLHGTQALRPFRYRNFGTLATIGRKRAVVDFGRIKFSGLPAWLLWSTAHLYFLVGFRNRWVVGATWMWSYMTFDRGARLITGLDTMARKQSGAPGPQDAVTRLAA